MSESRRWVLTDQEAGVYVDQWSQGGSVDAPGGGPAGGRADWSIRKRRLHGGLSDGVDVVDLDNGLLALSILPTRGMGVHRGRFADVALGWNSPARGPVHPAFVRPEDLGGLGWLAGFDEWIVRCGLAFNGPPGVDSYTDDAGVSRSDRLTLHGRIANLPARHVEACVEFDGEAARELAVVGRVDESFLFFPQLELETTYSTTPGSNRFTLRDAITNNNSRPAEVELLYHCN
ncbi:MAG: DUF4432 family protein, partial [Planctomycetia bacterium]